MRNSSIRDSNSIDNIRFLKFGFLFDFYGFSDLFLEWLLAVALVGGIVAPLNYRWVSISLKKDRSCFVFLMICFLWKGRA